MNRIIFTGLFALVIMVFACKSDTKKVELPSNPNNEKPAASPHNNDFRANALSILDFRNKETEGKSFSIIEADTWEYQFIYTKGKMSEEGAYAGIWIDFRPDQTYAYGTNKKVDGGGKYHYNSDRAILLMVDNDGTKKPQEWSAKFAGDAMVLVGTNTYNDNSIQMKLERVSDTMFQ